MAADLRQGMEYGGFRIESLLGRGGMGVVYRATQVSLQRVVALKLIAPELAAEEAFRERFWREARMAASLEHPHVLPVYEVGEAEGDLYLALRYVEGRDLRSLLAEGPLSPERTVRIVTQLCSALEAAHARGLLHRDVKPENVLVLGEEGAEHAYLTDFGLARPQAERGLTKTGELFGSLDYLAPELIEGGEASPRSDVYALGCLLYACLTGQPPFLRAQEAATLWAHVKEPVPLPSAARPELGERFDGILESALAKDPGERFQSAGALAEALEKEAPARPVRRGETATNLPRPLTSFVGRERELGEVVERLEAGARLLTLTGPGGSGKTRLALAAASARTAAYEGMHWVGLATLRDPALVTETISQTLGAKDGLAEHIGDKRLLLLLDNFEQVVEAAPELASLLGNCPNLSLLVTSRELLRVQGEREYPVPPLAEAEAIELFCARSGLAAAEEISELCARLDNLPLAVELAAARTKALSPGQILDRLSQRLDLLRGGRDTDARQQTLRATIEWSYELLSPEEQDLFARLSVFAGGCTLEAAEQVADADLDTLQSLLDKSLIRRRDTDVGSRYWMLETIREYASERLEESAEAPELRAAHAAWYARRVVDLYRSLREYSRETAAIVREELANARAALDLALERDDAAVAGDLIYGLWFYWLTSGSGREAASWARRYLDSGREHVSPVERLPGDFGAAEILRFTGDAERAADLKREFIAIGRSHPHATIHGSPIARGMAATLSDLVYMELDEGRAQQARTYAEEALALRRELGEPYGVAHALMAVAFIAYSEHDFGRARDILSEGLAEWEEAGAHGDAQLTLLGIAECELLLGRPDETAIVLRKVILELPSLGDRMATTHALRIAGMLAQARGDSERCAMLFGAADRIEDESGVSYFGKVENEVQREFLGRARRELDDEVFGSAYERGAALTDEAALALAEDMC